MAYKPLKFSVSETWAEQLRTVGLVEVGSFTAADLKRAGVAGFYTPRGVGRARPRANVGVLSADEPRMRKVISAVTRGHFFYSSWYRTEGRQDPEANDRGHTHIRSERREIHALVLASGQLAALIATEEGDVWHFLLATLEVAAEQLAAAVFAPAVSDTPDTFMSGWMAAWPAPGGSGEVNQEDLEMNGLGARSDVVRVTVDRNFGDPRSEVIENADMETLTGIYLNSFRQAAADVLQAA